MRKSTSLKDKVLYLLSLKNKILTFNTYISSRNNRNQPMKGYTKEIILNKLIESCLTFDAKLFKTYLQSEIVITDATDKKKFYGFFEKMLITAKSNSVEPMSFKIEMPHWEDGGNMKYYNLYDSVHKHPRLSLRVKESENSVYIETMPF